VASLRITDMSTARFHRDRKLVTDGQRPASRALKKAAKVCVGYESDLVLTARARFFPLHNTAVQSLSITSFFIVKFVTPDFVWWYSQALRPEAGVVSQESRAEWDEEEAPERDAVRCADRSSNKLPALHARDAHTYISLTMVFHMRRLDENTS
jgi:hypothetical protein